MGQRAGRDRLDLRDMEGGVDWVECGGRFRRTAEGLITLEMV